MRCLYGVYGAERDRAIAEAKVVLNVHFYEDSIHEIVRTSHLLANGKAVVCECNPATEIDEDIRQAVVARPYGELVEACVALLADEPRRREVERQGLEIFSRRCQAAMLAEAIAATSPPLPRMINLGSGKSWTPAYLNIDVDPKWDPDLLADISDPQWLDKAFVCPRFGVQRLSRGGFDVIVTNDVLEHIPDLPAFMTSCLALLGEGGRMLVERAARPVVRGLAGPHPRARLQRAQLALLHGLALVSGLDRGALRASVAGDGPEPAGAEPGAVHAADRRAPPAARGRQHEGGAGQAPPVAGGARHGPAVPQGPAPRRLVTAAWPAHRPRAAGRRRRTPRAAARRRERRAICA